MAMTQRLLALLAASTLLTLTLGVVLAAHLLTP